MSFNYPYYGSYIGHKEDTMGVWGVGKSSLSSVLYDFTSATFTVARALNSSYNSDSHRFGPTLTEVRNWMTGTSNGASGWSWANTYVDMPVQGYQRWTIPETATYRIYAKGAHAGYTDSPYDYMRGVTVQADFALNMGDQLIIAVGQGVPDYQGDHCNGGAGASWVALGSNISTALMLLVGNGAGGDTSDGGTKGQPNVSLNRNVTNVGGVTGLETTPINSSATTGYGGISSGGYLGSGTGSYPGGGFRSGNLVGGTRSNSTAGYGGFGGGSGGIDESGSAGGGFTGANGQDNTNITGHGSSFIRDTGTNQQCYLNNSTTTWQSSSYHSFTQYQGIVYIVKQ